ncbi:MAG TPA: GGDEF domain-containing protein [Rubrivivax sp.]|nr:GGDEF domain-containing protein [Rubrivivax sp.]
MLSALTATEMAFLQIAVLQAVAACMWGLGAWLARAERAALAHWAAYSGLSAITWLLLALYFSAPPLPVVLAGVCSVIALRRGIRLFVGRPAGWTGPLLLLGLVLAGGLLDAGADTAWRPLQAAINFGVLAALYLATAWDLRRHARDDLQWRFPLLLSLPLLLGGLAFGGRALRALLAPESVAAEMNVHSTLNVGSALSYIVLVLLLHAALTALVVSRLLGRLQHLARRDPLTGLLNRRAMHAALDQHARRRRRAADTFSVLMIDVDHFKSVNDRHGHEAGDRALTHIARLLTQALRTQDRVARFGGEEFLVLLPTAGLARARAEAEILRLQLRSQPLPLAEQLLHLSVSIGVAEWAGPAEDLSRLLARADAALYRAKRGGRDRVEADADDAGELLPRVAG